MSAHPSASEPALLEVEGAAQILPGPLRDRRTHARAGARGGRRVVLDRERRDSRSSSERAAAESPPPARRCSSSSRPTSGTIRLRGRDITRLNKAEMRPLRREMQLIFQDPFSSLNPRMTAGAIVREPLWIHGIGTASERDERVGAGVQPCRICARNRRAIFPTSSRVDSASASESSRAPGARTEASSCATSACRPSTCRSRPRSSTCSWTCRRSIHLAFLFIAHDLAVVEHISHRVGGDVPRTHRRVDRSPPPVHFSAAPLHRSAPVRGPGPRSRCRAAQAPDPGRRRAEPDIAPPSGCHFHPRCLPGRAMERCRVEAPELHEESARALRVVSTCTPGSVPAGS